MEKKSIKSIEDFEIYQKAVKLFEDLLEEDLPILQKTFTGRTIAGNHLRSLDSICANMEEDYERKPGKEIKNFFRMSKGSAGEARGRYKRLKKLLPQQTVNYPAHRAGLQKIDYIHFISPLFSKREILER